MFFLNDNKSTPIFSKMQNKFLCNVDRVTIAQTHSAVTSYIFLHKDKHA